VKETLSAEPSALARFAQEAQLLARLQHPALPRVSDHFFEDNRAFLVMQFITGVDLAKIIAQQPGPFPQDQVVAWADQLLDALIYLHSQERQVIHRDIKPHNLKLTATGQIALLDFGLAKTQPADSSCSFKPGFAGYTRQYAPLEQIQDLATGPESDIYALGATLYYLLTGHKPIDALTRAAAITHGEPDPLKPANEIYESVGPEIAAILSKAMAQRPEERYASASDFREALRCVGRTSSRRPGHEEESRKETVETSDLKAEPTGLKALSEGSTTRSGGLLMVLILVVSLAVATGVFYGHALGSASASDQTSSTEVSPVENSNSITGSVDHALDVNGKTENSNMPDSQLERQIKYEGIAEHDPQAGHRQRALTKRPDLAIRKADFQN